MSKGSESKRQRLAKPGKLSIALLENITKPLVGEKFQEILREPSKQKETFAALMEALRRTEQRFHDEHGETGIGAALLQVELSVVEEVQKALWAFY